MAQEQQCRNAPGLEGSSRAAGQGSGRARLLLGSAVFVRSESTVVFPSWAELCS